MMIKSSEMISRLRVDSNDNRLRESDDPFSVKCFTLRFENHC
jgi:hypothetical protein